MSHVNLSVVRLTLLLDSRAYPTIRARGSYDCTPIKVSFGALAHLLQENAKYLTQDENGKWELVSFPKYKSILTRSCPQVGLGSLKAVFAPPFPDLLPQSIVRF